MNYFPFDPCPRVSAIALDDKRLTRVFHEATMTLSKAQYRLTGEVGPYAPNVPIPTRLLEWVEGEGERWFVAWTAAMLVAMIDRYGQLKVNGYSCYQRHQLLAPRFREPDPELVTPAHFPNLARATVKGLDYSDWQDTHAAYREYMRVQWNGIDKRPCTWTHHGPPVWASDGIEAELRRLGLLP